MHAFPAVKLNTFQSSVQGRRVQKWSQVRIGFTRIYGQGGEIRHEEIVPFQLEHFISPVDRAHIHVEIAIDAHHDEVAVGFELNFAAADGDVESVAEDVAR